MTLTQCLLEAEGSYAYSYRTADGEVPMTAIRDHFWHSVGQAVESISLPNEIARTKLLTRFPEEAWGQIMLDQILRNQLVLLEIAAAPQVEFKK